MPSRVWRSGGIYARIPMVTLLLDRKIIGDSSRPEYSSVPSGKCLNLTGIETRTCSSQKSPRFAKFTVTISKNYVCIYRPYHKAIQ